MYMCKVNTTGGEGVTLLGFGKLESSVLVFIIFLMVYIATLSGNNLIILLVSRIHQLHTPMYFFLMHLSICDILFTTNIVPSMLHIILKGVGVISIQSCITQFYIYGTSTIAECFILTVMSYDRYLAICKPLHYMSTMDLSVCCKLVGSSWLLGALSTLNTVLMIFTLDFCGPKVIDHFICDIAPLIKLSCSDTFLVELAVSVLSCLLIIAPFVFIIVTYSCIFITILNIHSATGRQKTFSTCSSHLTSVSIFYGTLITIYVVPSRGHLVNLNKVLFLLYTVVTPLFNPIIYSLRNHEMRKAIDALLYNGRVWTQTQKPRKVIPQLETHSPPSFYHLTVTH